MSRQHHQVNSMPLPTTSLICSNKINHPTRSRPGHGTKWPKNFCSTTRSSLSRAAPQTLRRAAWAELPASFFPPAGVRRFRNRPWSSPGNVLLEESRFPNRSSAVRAAFDPDANRSDPILKRNGKTSKMSPAMEVAMVRTDLFDQRLTRWSPFGATFTPSLIFFKPLSLETKAGTLT